MRGEELYDSLLRRLREDRDALIEIVVCGGASADNVAEGYRDLTGQIKALYRAIILVREIFLGDKPEVQESSLAERHYGV